MLMYNLIEPRNNFAKLSGSLWEYHQDDRNDNKTNSESFKSRFTNNTGNAGTAKNEIPVP